MFVTSEALPLSAVSIMTLRGIGVKQATQLRHHYHSTLRHYSLYYGGDCLGDLEAPMPMPERRVNEILERDKSRKSDITREGRLAVKTLQSDTNIIIVPAHKGNTSVLMYKLEYKFYRGVNQKEI